MKIVESMFDLLNLVFRGKYFNWRDYNEITINVEPILSKRKDIIYTKLLTAYDIGTEVYFGLVFRYENTCFLLLNYGH